MSSTSSATVEAAASPRHEEELDPAAIARQLESALRGLAACAAPEQEPRDVPVDEEVRRRRRLAAWVAGLPRTKQLRLAGAASLLDGQFDDEARLP